MTSETAKKILHRRQPGGPEGAPWLGAARGPRRGPLAIARAKNFWLAQTIQSQLSIFFVALRLAFWTQSTALRLEPSKI